MTATQVGWALVCVTAVACGQLLFKRAGLEIEDAGGWGAVRPLAYVAFALCVYALATLAWIGLLRQVSLVRVYPFMALSFVLVPLGGAVLFGESITLRYCLGVGLIIAGLLVALESG